MTVAFAGSGASDCRNVTTSSLTHSSTARASAGLTGECDGLAAVPMFNFHAVTKSVKASVTFSIRK